MAHLICFHELEKVVFPLYFFTAIAAIRRYLSLLPHWSCPYQVKQQEGVPALTRPPVLNSYGDVIT